MDIDIGKAIYIRRKVAEITQAELAEGIMDISNLSKLESGRQIPTPENLELLLEKLGVNEPALLEKPLGKNEIKMAEIKKEITNAIYEDRCADAEAAISRCENDPDCAQLWKSKFFKQYILTSKAAIAFLKGEALLSNSLYHEALKMTYKSFDESKISEGLFTNVEIEIINSIAVLYAENNERSRGIDIFKRLIRGIESSHFKGIIKRPMYTGLFYNLSKYLSLDERNQEALEVCNRGINVCYLSGILYALPGLHFNKSYVLHKFGRLDEAKHTIELCCNLLCDMKNFKEAKRKKNKAEKRFGFVLDVPALNKVWEECD